jgi:uncharacterized FlaG/YvyC family protein
MNGREASPLSQGCTEAKVKITSIPNDGIPPQTVSSAKAGAPNTADVSKNRIGGDGSSGSESTRSKVDSLNTLANDSRANENPVVINGLGVGLKFSVDKETNTHVIQVVDLKTGEVIRQIPPKEVVSFLRAAGLDKGVLFSRRL